jgi:hypothetical protein
MAIISNDPITNEYGMSINNCYIRAGKKLTITAVWDDTKWVYTVEIDIETFLNKEAKLSFKEPMSKINILFTVDKLGDNVFDAIYDDLKRMYPNYTDDL